ncbi:MAG: sulfatase family protein [Thermoguttaceae bacterium]
MASAWLGGEAALADRPSKTRPNILYIMTDQQHAGMLSCAGNKHLRTPAMDQIAASGARFERAYCANPVCLPSRVAMMTGHLPSRFGIRSNADNRGPIPETVLRQSLGWLFRNAGYETAYGGKTHWPKGMTPQSLGFDDLTRDERDGLAEACVRFIQTKREKPFLLVASFINPHDICFMAIDDHTRAAKKKPMYPQQNAARRELAAAMRPPAGVSEEEFLQKLCPPLPDNYEIPAMEPECISRKYVQPGTFRDHARRNWSERQWRLHRWAYCRLTERVDGHIARLLDALRSAGLLEQTVVVFASDHGDMDAAHRLEHKSVLYEESARVPFIVSYPGVTRAGLVDTTHLVSAGLDLIPTLCDYAGINPPPGLPGRSVRDLAEGRQPAAWRDQLVVESHAGRMLRTDRYKYVVYESGQHREQLIDLATDPGEMANLAERPEYRQVLDEHRRRLRRWVETTPDQIGRAYVPDAAP